MNLEGVLFLPVTPFDSGGRVAPGVPADGLLLMPPHLAQGPGLTDYVRAVAAGLPLIVHQRAPNVLEPETAVEPAAVPGVIGLKHEDKPGPALVAR